MDFIRAPGDTRPDHWRQPVLALGNFDGVHLGHRSIIEDVVQTAAGRGATPLVLTFDPHPLALVPRTDGGLYRVVRARAVGTYGAGTDPREGWHVQMASGTDVQAAKADARNTKAMAYAGVPPGILATGIPGFGREHGERMSLYNHMMTAGCLVEDTGVGRVGLGPDLEPWMSFRLSRQLRMNLFASTGLSTNSTDFSSGATLSYRF